MEKFLTRKENGFVNLDKSFVSMWEMFLICFIKQSLKPNVTKVKTSNIAKGFAKTIGNKGGVAYSFMLQNRMFNFIATHLRHGQNRQDERNEMASQLVQEMKMQQLQSTIVGLESDFLGDINFFLGDVNYRLNTTYDYLNNDNVRNQAISMISTHDQLGIARKEGNFPLYEEADITFFPSYK